MPVDCVRNRTAQMFCSLIALFLIMNGGCYLFVHIWMKWHIYCVLIPKNAKIYAKRISINAVKWKMLPMSTNSKSVYRAKITLFAFHFILALIITQE